MTRSSTTSSSSSARGAVNTGDGESARYASDATAAIAVVYPDWPLGLGDPASHAALDGVTTRASASGKSRKELVVASRAQRSRAVAVSGGSIALTGTSTIAGTCELQNLENLELPIVQCHRALATRKCLSCVQFDELKVGYYCDACFAARHPVYRLNHSWIPIEDDVTEEHEWIYHLTRLKLDQDIRELELLLAKTDDFLARSHTAVSRTAAPPTVSRPTTRVSGSTSAMTRKASTTLPFTVSPPPLNPSSALRTTTGELDFDATRKTTAAIQGTLRGLIEQVRAELARKAPMTRHEALVKIQRMWKIRSARKQLKALVRSVYASFEDPATGETYYYNRKTNTTQWSKPKAFGDDDELVGSSSSKAVVPHQHQHRASSIPKRVFNSCEEEEVDAAQRIQGMVRAHKARAQMRKLLSSVYEKIWDATSARFYYHNTRTKQVKWERPRWVCDADLLTPRARQQHAAEESKQQRLALLRASVTQEQAATMLQRAYRRKKGFEALLERCRQVYERIFDASQNAYYYHNTRTKETTWEKPAILRRAKADVLTPRSRLAQTLADAAVASPSGSSSRTKRTTPREWTEEQAAVCLQGLFRARQAKRALDVRLAQTFRKVWDPDSERFYYVDLRTQAVSWEPPTLLLRSGVQVDEFDALVCVAPPLLAAASDVVSTPLQATALDSVVCGVDEILLASDGAIESHSVQLGERVTPNQTLSDTVREDAYHFYHLCILRHEHEHQINVNLTLDTHSREDANLYLSSEESHPRVGHSTWIAQRPGSDFIKLYTYLDGFPRGSESDAHRRRTVALHIGVRGMSASARYNLTVSVLDLPQSQDIRSRERFYAAQHERDRARWGMGDISAAAATAADGSVQRRGLRGAGFS